MMEELLMKARECAEAIVDLAKYTMEDDSNITIDECFPANGQRFFQMNGKTYKLRMHCEVVEV